VYVCLGGGVVVVCVHSCNVYVLHSDHFAFQLDAQLEKGTSGPCSTFNSPCLASSEMFECHKFEVWAPILHGES